LARVEASDTRPAGGVCVGDKRGRLLDRYVPSCVGCGESGEDEQKQEGQIRQRYGDRRVIVAIAVHGGLTTISR